MVFLLPTLYSSFSAVTYYANTVANIRMIIQIPQKPGNQLKPKETIFKQKKNVNEWEEVEKKCIQNEEMEL